MCSDGVQNRKEGLVVLKYLLQGNDSGSRSCRKLNKKRYHIYKRIEGEPAGDPSTVRELLGGRKLPYLGKGGPVIGVRVPNLEWGEPRKTENSYAATILAVTRGKTPGSIGKSLLTKKSRAKKLTKKKFFY